MGALGVTNRHTGYFAFQWNWLDFVVVFSAVFEETMFLIPSLDSKEGGGLVVLRVMRVLRPLKSISSMPKLQTMIATLTGSVAPMMRAMAMLLFFVFIMAIFGLTFFMGTLDFWEDTSYMVSRRARIPNKPINDFIVF